MNWKLTNLKLNSSGINYIIGVIFTQLFISSILFISAGTLTIKRFWIFIIINFSYSIAEIILLIKNNPALINRRGKPVKSDTIGWDKYLMRMYVLSVFILPAVIGLDYGRFQRCILSKYYMIPGYLIYTSGILIITWSMLVNPFFERTVRIQKDRNHKVITNGPYKFIRHPGYLGSILWILSIPFILGSLFGFIPATLSILILIIRTYMEDNTLKSQLTGYKEYCNKVRYRIFTGFF